MNLLPGPLPGLSARADITFPSATRLLFIFAPSCEQTRVIPSPLFLILPPFFPPFFSSLTKNANSRSMIIDDGILFLGNEGLMAHLQPMNATAGSRALAPRQIDETQLAAAAGRPPPPRGRRFFASLADHDREQSVASAAARVLQRGRCLPCPRPLLHAGHQRAQGAHRVMRQTLCAERKEFNIFSTRGIENIRSNKRQEEIVEV